MVYQRVDIAVADVRVGPRLRTEDDVRDLVESIPRLGLLSPILVTETTGTSGYDLVAGRRRLLAHKALGLTTIEAKVMPAGEEAAVAEAVENLHRKDLTPFERSQHELRWKEYLLATGEAVTAQAAYAASGKRGGRGNIKADELSSQAIPTPSAIIAEQTGQTRRQVQKRLQIAENITEPAAAEIRRIEQDSKMAFPVATLQEIAREPSADAQMDAVRDRMAKLGVERESVLRSRQALKELPAEKREARQTAEDLRHVEFLIRGLDEIRTRPCFERLSDYVTHRLEAM